MLKNLLGGLAALALATAPTAAAADENDRRVEIHNHLGESIWQLHWSNTATTAWGPDQLGDGVIIAGARRAFWISDGTGRCRFDFRAVTRSGRELTRRNVNVCTESVVDFGSGDI